jgi:hypothetical protein
MRHVNLISIRSPETEDPLALGELKFRSKTKAGPLEDKQLSRAGNKRIALVR